MAGAGPVRRRAHIALLRLARRGEFGAGEDHLAAANLFQSEELDFGPVRNAWRRSRGRPARLAVHRRFQLPLSNHAPITLAGPELGAPRLARRDAVRRDAGSGIRGGLADGLTHDIITRLAKLGDFFVIARGSVFALAERTSHRRRPAAG